MLRLPSDIKERERLLASMHKIKQNPDFLRVCEYLECEQAEIDKKLRRADDNYLLVAGSAQLLERFLELLETSSTLLQELRNNAKR